MIIKMRKEVFHSGIFHYAFARPGYGQYWDTDYLRDYESVVSDGKYVYFHLEEIEYSNRFSHTSSPYSYIFEDGVLYVGDNLYDCECFEKWGECEIVVPAESHSWLVMMSDETPVLLTTGEVCYFGELKTRWHHKGGKLIRNYNVAAVGCYIAEGVL